MNAVTLKLPKPHAGQQEIISNAGRFNVVCCGRRYGKSVLAINRLIEPALAGYPVAYFAPVYKTLLEVWREIARILKPVTTKINATERRIELATGGVIEFWSLEDPEASRGRKYKRIVIDEAAKARGLQLAWQSTIRATLMDYSGDAYFMSTPRGRDYFAELFNRGNNAAQYPSWKSFTAPTSSNPFIPASEIEEMKADLGGRLYAQEVLAEILTDREGALWTQSLIDRGRHLGPLPEFKRIVIGLDPATTSGEQSNKTGIVVAGLGFDGHAYVIKNLTIKGTPHEWATVVCNAYDEFNADRVIGETNQGGAMIEHTLRSINPRIAYKGVVARQGKTIRAEPISALYEQGKIHHTEDLTLFDLEMQMTNWVQGEESPDALDAAVHALTDLLPLKTNGGRTVHTAPTPKATW